MELTETIVTSGKWVNEYSESVLFGEDSGSKYKTHVALYLNDSHPSEFSLIVPTAIGYEILNRVNHIAAMMRIQKITGQKIIPCMEEPRGLAVFINDSLPMDRSVSYIAADGSLVGGMRFYKMGWRDGYVHAEPISECLTRYGKRVLYVSADPAHLASMRLDTLNIAEIPPFVYDTLPVDDDKSWCVVLKKYVL